MTKILLIVHVLAAILAVGPVAVAASMFPAVTRKALGGSPDAGTLRLLHRICRVYALVGIAVPFFGLATAGPMHVFGDAWVLVSIGLTAVAAAVLALVMLPGQRAVLSGLGNATVSSASVKRLAMTTGVFNLLWATVTVLMIVRPGSTTGV
jgi:hypothetical protein